MAHPTAEDKVSTQSTQCKVRAITCRFSVDTSSVFFMQGRRTDIND